MNEFVYIGLLIVVLLTIRQVYLFIRTKGTMESEKIIHDCKGNPKHIIKTYHDNLFGDRVIMEKHPESLKETISKFANDPFYKYIAKEIREKGSWSESDGIPKEVMEESKKYRKQYE